jgi:DnaK suppressor protein
LFQRDCGSPDHRIFSPARRAGELSCQECAGFVWSVCGGGRVEESSAMDVETYRDALLRKKGELLGGNASKPLQWTMENNSGRQGDMADQASGNNEVHIQLKLKQTDAKILQAIEEALHRIDNGTYGVCRDCGEQIAPARLNAIPWTRSCIACKEKQKA